MVSGARQHPRPRHIAKHAPRVIANPVKGWHREPSGQSLGIADGLQTCRQIELSPPGQM